jgi:hypothetical protein
MVMSLLVNQTEKKSFKKDLTESKILLIFEKQSETNPGIGKEGVSSKYDSLSSDN